jgi:CRISPR-associated endonuclease Cas2
MSDTDPSLLDAERRNTPSPFIVAYDISDDRRRSRLFRLLRSFGEPLQDSVFVCWLDSSGRTRLSAAIARFTAKAEPGERIACLPLRYDALIRPATSWVSE